MKDAEDEAFEAIERAQGWRKRQIEEKRCENCGEFGPCCQKQEREWVEAVRLAIDAAENDDAERVIALLNKALKENT